MFEGSIRNLCKYFDSTQSIQVIAEQYLQHRYKTLLWNLKNLFENRPDLYKRNFTDHIWSETIFFGLEKDTISCKLAYFELKTSANLSPILDSGIIDLAYSPVAPFLARAGGHTDAINSLLYSPGIWKRGYKAGIDSLLKIQSRATPDNVAFPISIILITNKKTKWLCPCSYGTSLQTH
jgi:hypothetical protein